MTLQTSILIVSFNRFAGWVAINSGIIGILAFGFLLMAVLESADALPHDVGLILQSLSMIPVVFASHTLSSQQSSDLSRALSYLGVGTLLCIIFFMLLGFAKVLGDLVYMVPQGVLGIWIIFVCLRKTDLLPRGLRRLGMTAGLGLALVALFPIGYALLVDPIILMGGPFPEGYIIEITLANQILHHILWIGSLIGLPTYSIWTILLGSHLLREGSHKGAGL